MKQKIYDHGEYRIVTGSNNYRVEDKKGELIIIKSALSSAENYINKLKKKGNKL